ncbi:MAG: hypothetical protein IJ600_12690 [Lachnospiraceae bacterium]|nr:hypothetical protein [Lachnospiraceae bacterium]
MNCNKERMIWHIPGEIFGKFCMTMMEKRNLEIRIGILLFALLIGVYIYNSLTVIHVSYDFNDETYGGSIQELTVRKGDESPDDICLALRGRTKNGFWIIDINLFDKPWQYFIVDTFYLDGKAMICVYHFISDNDHQIWRVTAKTILYYDENDELCCDAKSDDYMEILTSVYENEVRLYYNNDQQ